MSCTGRRATRRGQARALNELAEIQRLTGGYESSARSADAALAIRKELGDRLAQANTRTLLAEVRGLTGDYEGAARDLEASIATYQDLGNRGNQAWALNHYGAVITAMGDQDRAITVYRDALHLAREGQQPDDEAIALHGIGENHLRTGRVQDGAACLHQAQEIYQRLGMPQAEQVTERLAEIAIPEQRRTSGLRA